MDAAQQRDIYGAKGGSDKPKTPTEAPDSLRSVAMAKILIAMGEGEFAGNPTAQDIYLDNTPLQDPQGNMNFPNVKWEYRNGSIEQGYIQGIPSVENETTVGIELRSGTPWVRAISNTDLSAVRLRFAWPALQSVDASGNVNGYRIEYKVELATDGGAYQQVLSEAVDGKTTSTYERTRRIDLPVATSGWLIRVTRITANQNNNKIADTMQIAGFTEVIDAKLRYPNTALLYIEFSSEQFRSIPTVTVDTKLKKMPVPSNYDPGSRSYTGIWDGTFKQAWTDNPAWMTYDITVSDRFGLGRRIKPWQVDKWELYRIAQYCDQLVPDGKGGQEPRFICNLNLQGKADAWSLLRDISAIYRGMTYWAQGQLFSLSDMPRATDFDFAYTRANVIDGKFTYSSASERTRYSRALISYDNPANNYDTDVTSVTDPKLQRRYGDNPLEISAIGCTRESEAQRRGKWALLTNSKDRGISFKVGLDGRIPLPGYVIPVADELLAGRAIGGRISAVAGRTITLDRDTQAKAGDRLILNLPNGKCEGRTVQSVAGRAVTVTVAYSAVPERELVWALDADDLAVPLYRVTAVSRPEPGVFEISAVQYDPSKFAFIDTGARLEERPISVIPITVVPAPASVTLSASSVVSQGIAVATMTITWPAVNGAVGYDVEWRKDSGNWIKMPRTGATGVDVVGIYAGAYVARVRAVSAFDISSVWRASILTNLKGKEGLPPAVSFLTATSLLFGIGLKWGFPAGAEDTQRTEIWYGPANNLASATKLADLAYPQSDYAMQSLLAGASFFFWARLVDRTGNIGPFYPVGNGVMGQASADAGPILDQIAGQISETELGQTLLERIELIDGPPTLPGSVSNRLNELDERVGEVTDHLQELVSEGQVALTEAQAALQQQIDQVSTIAKSGEYQKDKAYAVGASTRLSDRLYQAKIAVPADASGAKAPPNATYWVDVGQVVSDSNGLAARVNTTETKITSIEGVNTSQGTAITGLNNSLTTTNTNVTAAQTAANAANTLAGGKGKVLVQTTAPAVADQLTQNLWIDITGGANTPKRWTGSAWVAVTDKVATDAAAAAANALSVANTKADASLVSSLTTRVESAEGTISSQGTAITGLTNSLTTTNTNVTAAQTAANAANTLAGGKGKVLVQTGAPAAADQLVQNLWIDITGGANTPKRWTGSAWAAVTDKVATDAAAAAANALSVANTKADASAFNNLTTRVTAAEGTISSQGTSITGLNNSLTTTNTNVTAAQTAANAANTLAGGKGKVLVQTGAPATADQLAQNLWIDITGGANTPKRWTGSAWAAVTDKVATDAAAAAANALTLANTKADASAVSALDSRVTSAEGVITSQGSSLTQINNTLTRVGANSPTKVYQSLFTALAVDTWRLTNSTGATSAFSNVAGNTSGGTLTLDSGPTNKNWWGATNKLVRFDPSRLYKLSLRVQQVSVPSGTTPTIIAGVDCYAEDGVTRISSLGANSPNSSHYVLTQGASPAVGTWVEYTTYVKGFSIGSENGGLGSGTAAVPKRLKTGTAYFAPMIITGYSSLGGVVAVDYFTVEDMTDQVQIDATSAAVSALSSTVTQQGADLTSQGTSITGLNNSLTTTNTNVTAAQTAANAANTLAGGKGKVLVQTGAPAAADQLVQNLWIDITGGANTPKRWTGSAWAAVTDKVATDAAAAAANALSVANTKADASLVSSLTTRVESAEGTISSQGTAITGLNNNLTTTNTNVTAAQTAANAANTLAGGKGKVLVQTGAPAAADQLVQNLWIDITGGANTPKRWTGSAWAAVTDKVATDAAAAAANALSVANTKADASAVSSLTTRVESAEGTISSQGTAITGLTNSLTTTNTNVTAAQTAANAANTLAGGKGKVLVQTGAPAAADQLVQNLWIDITGGANTPKRWTGSAWAAVTDKVATDAAAAAANALSVANTKADASAVSSLTTRVTAAEGTISSQGTSITGLNNSLTTTNTNVSAAQTAANAANTLAGGKGKVLVQTTAPAAADQLVQNLWIDITGGANTPKRWTGSAWAAVTDKVATDAAAAAASALSVANTKADASAVSSLTTRVTATEDQITAQANKLDGIYVQVNPVLAGDAAGFAGSTASFVGVWSEQSARIEDGVALGQRIDVVTASVDEVSAAIQTETTARASADAALSSQITTVQAVANSASAAVQTVSQAQASTDGRLGTMWSVKMQVNAQGQYVAAGIGLGIENGPAGLQSTFLVSADTFAVVNGINGTLSSPFAVTGGQVFIRSAFIQDLSLSFGKISDNIQSDNYVANSTGWKLSKAGGMELNSTVAGQGRVQVTNRAVKVWDANGVLRVQLGDLSA
ncbi:phage tail protein [Pseudomonas sp. PDM29]|nr:phage tail protein [Pseudomonas sp. PDM29]